MSDSEDDLIGDPNDIDNIVEGQADDGDGEDGDEDNDNNQAAENVEGGDDEAVPPAPTTVKKRVSRPRLKLDPERLKGPRGIATIESYFKDFKFHGKGYEKHDLNMLLKRLEHWAHRLYPRFQFEDCLEKIEKLGHKKIVQVYVKKIRLGMETIEDVVRLVDEDEDDPSANEPADTMVSPIDAFDELLSQQLAQARASVTSAPSTPSTPFAVPSVDKPLNGDTPALTPEQRERMLRNRVLAEERRLARLKAKHEEEQRLLSLTVKLPENVETTLENNSQKDPDASESLLGNSCNEAPTPESSELQNVATEITKDTCLENFRVEIFSASSEVFENKSSIEEEMPHNVEVSQNVSRVVEERLKNVPDNIEKSHASDINDVEESETGLYENLETMCVESIEDYRNKIAVEESSVMSLDASKVLKNDNNLPVPFEESIKQIKQDENLDKLEGDHYNEGSVSLLEYVRNSEDLTKKYTGDECGTSNNSGVTHVSSKISADIDDEEIASKTTIHSSSTEDHVNSSQMPSQASPDASMDVDESTQFVSDSMDVDATQFTP